MQTESRPKKKLKWWLILIIVVGGVAVLTVGAGFGALLTVVNPGVRGPGPTRPAIGLPDTVELYDLAQQCVRYGLRDPAAARFPDIRAVTVKRSAADTSRWSVEGYVRARSALGLMMRVFYEATLRDSAGTWKCGSVTLRLP